MLACAGLAYAAAPQDDVHDANQVVQRSMAAAQLGDLTAARGAYNQYDNTWSEIEEGVRAASPDAYRAIERAMDGVAAAFDAQPADAYRQTETDMALAASLASQSSPETLDVVSRMAARLEPFRDVQRYGIFDATIILLREGLEALLVMVALSAFLKKAGNAAGQRW